MTDFDFTTYDPTEDAEDVLRLQEVRRPGSIDLDRVTVTQLVDYAERYSRMVDTLLDMFTEVVEHLTVDDDECVHVLWEPEPDNPYPTAPALPDDLWCRIRKVVES